MAGIRHVPASTRLEEPGAVHASCIRSIGSAARPMVHTYEALRVPYLKGFVYMKPFSYGTRNASYARSIGSAVRPMVRTYEALRVPSLKGFVYMKPLSYSARNGSYV